MSHLSIALATRRLFVWGAKRGQEPIPFPQERFLTPFSARFSYLSRSLSSSGIPHPDFSQNSLKSEEARHPSQPIKFP